MIKTGLYKYLKSNKEWVMEILDVTSHQVLYTYRNTPEYAKENINIIVSVPLYQVTKEWNLGKDWQYLPTKKNIPKD